MLTLSQNSLSSLLVYVTYRPDAVMVDDTRDIAEELFNLHDLDPDTSIMPTAQSAYYDKNTFNNLLMNQPELASKLALLYLNIRSLPQNFDSLTDYLNLLNFDFPVIGLVETWLNETNESLYCMPEYSMFCSSRSERRGGGVAILSHHQLNATQRADLSVNDDHIECVFVDISPSPLWNVRATIGVVYRPPNACVSSFFESLTSIMSRAGAERKLCFLMGDLNINLLSTDSNSNADKLTDIIYSHSFRPLIDQPTRITATSSTLIDNILCNDITERQISGLLQTDISDHFPLFTFFATTQRNSALTAEVAATYRLINTDTMNIFNQQLAEVNWEEVLRSENAQDAFDLFLSLFLSVYSNTFPLKQRALSSSTISKKQSNPWITNNIRAIIKNKNKLHKKFLRCPSVYNEIQFKRERNRLNNIVKQSKKNHYRQQFEQNKNNIRKTWQLIKHLIGVPSKQPISKQFNINGAVINSKADIANSFNDFFVSIGTKLAASIPQSNHHPRDYLDGNFPNTMFIRPVTSQEISKCISKLKDGSAGHDHILPKVIKYSKDLILVPLTHIINLSFTQGVVPNSLKIAHITPIYKSGDSEKVDNYRPISLLTTFSKIYEKIMYIRLYCFLEDNRVISNHQFGFRRNFSPELAINKAVDYITQSLDNKKHAIGLFLDIRKAFDAVNIEYLILKLSHYGIRGLALKWFQSYLTHRTQRVKYCNTLSIAKPVTCGVPQGSTLGPLLFLLYINDFHHCLNHLNPVLFADDTNLFLAGSNLAETEHAFNVDLGSLNEWFACNKLSLNLGKTHSMLFNLHPINSSQALTLRINNTIIDRVTVTKFLGVHIDHHLNWSQHTQHIANKISKSIGILNKTRPYLDRSTLRILYFSIVFPYLSYCHLVWGNAPNIYITPLFLLQKRAVRLIHSAPRTAHTDPLFRSSKIIRVPDLFTYFCSLFIYKYKHDLLPNSIKSDLNLFQPRNLHHTHSTRLAASTHHCITPKCRTSLCQRFLRYKSSNILNEFIVPLNLLDQHSVASLKKMLKHLLI